jgi:cytochrome P450
MLALLSDNVRRNPFALYDQLRSTKPVFFEEQSGLWLLFKHADVKRALSDHTAFSSQRGPEWLIFSDPPRHTKLRGLISQAFTPRMVANLEPRIRQLSRDLLNATIERGEMDLATDFAVPLPMLVIAEMLGVPRDDRPRFSRWIDALLEMSYTIPGAENAQAAMAGFVAATAEMQAYLRGLLDSRRTTPQDDLLTRLVQAEVDGDRLTENEIVGFFQLLLLAGSETTTNLINSTIICLTDHPDQFRRILAEPAFLPSMIEEVLRYRSPVQWLYRVTRHEIELSGQVVPAGKLVLAVIGAANRDPAEFPDPNRFDIARDPNPHLAFGHGMHFCLGTSLARLEAKIALSDLLTRARNLEVVDAATWRPRRGLHVHGPSSLPVRFRPAARIV